MKDPDLSYWLVPVPLLKEVHKMKEMYSNPIIQRAMNLYSLLELTSRFIDFKVEEWKDIIKSNYIPLNEYLKMTVEEYREYLKDWKQTPNDYLKRWNV